MNKMRGSIPRRVPKMSPKELRERAEARKAEPVPSFDLSALSPEVREAFAEVTGQSVEQVIEAIFRLLRTKEGTDETPRVIEGSL